MLYGLEPGLQKCFERHRSYKMFQELKLVFHTHARVERLPLTVLFLQNGEEWLNQWACAHIVWVLQLLESSGY